jgi:phosphoribosylformylglycinamidine synthase
MGKYIEMDFNGITRDQASEITDESCRKLLANPNTETYTFEIVEK